MAVDIVDHLPAVGLEPGGGVIGEPALYLAVDGNAIVIVKHDQLAQAQGACQGADLVGNALHQAAIPHEGVGVVVDNGVALAVELGRQHPFRQRHAHRVGQALAQGTRGGLDTRGIAVLGMAGCLAVQLAKILQLIHRQVIAGEVQQGVEQHGAVAVGQYEAVAVGPVRVGGVVLQVVIPQHLGYVSHPHGRTGVATVGFLYGIHAQGANGIGKFSAGGRHRFLQGGLAEGAQNGSVFSRKRRRTANKEGKISVFGGLRLRWVPVHIYIKIF